MAHLTIYVVKDMIYNLTGKHIICYNSEGDFVVFKPDVFTSRKGAYYIVNENMISSLRKRGIAKDKILVTGMPEVGRDKVIVRRLWQIGEKPNRIIPIGE